MYCKTIVTVLACLAFTGCVNPVRAVREYHTASKELRACVKVDGTEGVQEPLKSHLDKWATTRDAAWKLPEAAIDAYKSGKVHYENIREAVKD